MRRRPPFKFACANSIGDCNSHSNMHHREVVALPGLTPGLRSVKRVLTTQIFCFLLRIPPSNILEHNGLVLPANGV